MFLIRLHLHRSKTCRVGFSFKDLLLSISYKHKESERERERYTHKHTGVHCFLYNYSWQQSRWLRACVRPTRPSYQYTWSEIKAVCFKLSRLYWRFKECAFVCLRALVGTIVKRGIKCSPCSKTRAHENIEAGEVNGVRPIPYSRRLKISLEDNKFWFFRSVILEPSIDVS